MRRSVLVLLVAAAALFGAAAPAHAAGLEVGMEDEGLVLSNQGLAAIAVADWRQFGVDVVRIHARWFEIAPNPLSTTKPAGFKAADPNARAYQFDKLDTAINIVRNNGMRVMLTITGPGPVWASSVPTKRNGRYMPKPADYADFAKAVATRYKSYVDRYLLWNEPNQKGWLQPQWVKSGKTWVPESPHLYRALVRAAEPAVKAADPGAEVVIGELAPVGDKPISADTPMKPLIFLRALGCVDDKYKSIKTGECKNFKAAKGDTLGYHPHPQENAPDKVNPDVDEAQFADIPRLLSTLDKLKSRKRLSVSGNIHLTEFGYETNPPDKASGVTLALQTRYLQQAAYLAWTYKRVRGLSFYQWFDEPTLNLGSGTKRYANWQTGLLFNNGKHKPVLSTMPAPFVIDQAPGSSSGLLWGQVRVDANPSVTIQMRAKGASTWSNVATLNTGTDGLWSRKLTLAKGASYRYSWQTKPSLLAPLPEIKYSGLVDLSKSEKTRYHASLAF